MSRRRRLLAKTASRFICEVTVIYVRCSKP
jgi:hypothetical protein